MYDDKSFYKNEVKQLMPKHNLHFFLLSLNLFRTREYYVRNQFIILGIRPPINLEVKKY